MTPQDPVSTMLKASEVAKSFVTGLGQSVPFLLSCLVVSIFLWVVPDSCVPAQFVHLRGVFVALSLFLSVYFLLLWWFVGKQKRQSLWYLKHLGADERTVLQQYLKQNKTVGYFAALHGPVCSLVTKGILTYPSNLIPYSHAPVAIQPFVLIYLRKHPALIGLKLEDIGCEKVSDGSPPSPRLSSYD